MRARLSEIAAAAGVSPATVSRVLNGKTGVAVSTRESVIRALDGLGYERPERLRTRSGRLVGLVVPELDNPVFPAFVHGIESALTQYGYATVLCTQTPGGAHEDDLTRTLIETGVAGIIYVSGLHADATADPSRYQELRRRGLPIVLVNGHVEGIDALCISNDDVASMDLAVAHLAALGHERIGLAVGPPRFVPVVRKIAGFRAAMRRRLGQEDVERWVACTLFSMEGGAAAVRRLLPEGCTALICGSDVMALGAIRAARESGRRVPQDLSVVGYDDSALMAFTDPPLTTIRQVVPAMARAAARGLLDEIAAAEVGPRVEYLFRPELVVRGSTDAAPPAAVLGENPAAVPDEKPVTAPNENQD